MDKQIKKENQSALSDIKQQQFNRQPILENTIDLSNDGKWVIHRTIITDIKPVAYYEKVLSSANKA